jgi:hypothetical protein
MKEALTKARAAKLRSLSREKGNVDNNIDGTLNSIDV